MEYAGVPLNGAMFRQIADPAAWNSLRDALVPELDPAGIYAPHNDGSHHFSFDRFEAFLAARNIPWPRTEAGRLAADAKTFEDMTKGRGAELESLRQLRHICDKMRIVELAVGADNRNRTVLWPFKAKSG
jgi:hypothetical protein